MSKVSNQDLFPLCDGEVLPEDVADTSNILKRSITHACFEINRLVLQLKDASQNEKATLLNDLAQARETRENSLSELNNDGIEVEMEIKGLLVSNLIFKPIVLDESQLSPEDIGHSFDITIPFIEDEKAMKEKLHNQLASLRGKILPSSDIDTRSNS